MSKSKKKKKSKKLFVVRTRNGPSHRSNYMNWFPKILPYARTILSMLPIIPAEANTKAVKILGLVDIAFNFISTVLSGKTYHTGAFSMFVVSPAPLLVNSPLLAMDGTSYSVPGHPIRMRSLEMTIRNTSALEERSGQWAAVFIPFRELHDETHYADILKNMTFEEVAAMPHAKTSAASRAIKLTYLFRDKSQYCSQPRELTESIGFVCVIWDVRSRADFSSSISAASFNCEIQAGGTMAPYVIFGPKHRQTLSADKMKFKNLTTGDQVRVHNLDKGTVEHVALTHDYRDLFSRMSLKDQ